jgi:hypothetical protein
LKTAGILQPLPIPSWKWEDINMDFIVGLPNTSLRHDSIWVIVDRLTKTAHFLSVHTTYNAKKYAEIYLDQIVHLHGIPKIIISDHRAQFIARFWEQLQDALGTKLIRSSAYHPQTDGQTKRVNQILEDMLRACALQYDKNWDKYLSLAEFSYNNSYQTILKMAPFEALYGRRCRTPLSWSQTGERKVFGPDLVMEAEDKVKIIQNNLKAAQSRQKSYADIRRRPLRFGVKGKLAPRYIRPFEILEIGGPVAYRLQLPSQLAAIHNIFHVSQLKKCVKIPTEIIDSQAIKIEPNLTYTEHPLKVLDTKERSTRRETIRIYKIQWNHHTEEEATWETESYLQHNFPDFFQANLRN